MICEKNRLSYYALARNGGGLFQLRIHFSSGGVHVRARMEELAHGVAWSLQRQNDL